MFDFIEFQDIPLYGILGGVVAVCFIAFTIGWVYVEMFGED